MHLRLSEQSLANKIDDVFDLRRERGIHVLCLVETWLDHESVAINRLRASGCRVVDRPRPRVPDDTPATNHGGVAIVAAPGVRHTAVDVGPSPATFEVISARAAIGVEFCTIVLIYRPGSDAVTQAFFDDLCDLLDRVATTNDEFFVVGDVNIRLDRPDDVNTVQFQAILECYDLEIRNNEPTHDRGGQLDVVVARRDRPVSVVTTYDAGLSDHKLLQWSVDGHPADIPVVTVDHRPWRKVDIVEFRAAVAASPLCAPDQWADRSVDDLAQLYDSAFTELADRFAPIRKVSRRPRPSDPWFDAECRSAKRLTRRLERVAAAASRRPDVAIAAAANAAWTAQRRVYRDTLRQKREAFWRSTVDAQRSNPRRLWQTIDTTLGRGRQPDHDEISADCYQQFFNDKVAAVRSSTESADPPDYVSGPAGTSWCSCDSVDCGDVVDAIRALPDKCCAADPVPTSILKQLAGDVAPFLAALFNRSMTEGVVPASFKMAFITPLLKKPNLDVADVRSYRPISNLSVISKLLERLVARRMLKYLTVNNLLPRFQSAYRPHHSTETAVLKVLADILLAIDGGDLAGLALLDLSAAFDTVDYDVLLRRLQTTYGVGGVVQAWFRSYLTDRRQYVKLRTGRSSVFRLLCGVPQGSVLGPILFLLYTADLVLLIERHGLSAHLYADDTQIYGFSPPSSVDQLQMRLSTCIDEVAGWMSSNRLQLNAAKTEVLWCSSARRQHQLPTTTLRVCGDHVRPTAVVRDLGIYIDSDVSMRSHVTRTVASCFGVLRQLRSVRRSLSDSVFQAVVVALVLSRLDYGNATLSGLPQVQIRRLQAVMNAAARLIFSGRRGEHVTPLLRRLHWLRVPERISYKLAVLVFRCLQGQGPAYLTSSLQRVVDLPERRRLRSASTAALVVPASRLRIGDRAFPITAAKTWNSLPPEVTSSTTLATFKKKLKTHLFSISFPDSQ